MNTIRRHTDRVRALAATYPARLAEWSHQRERGDVPGWVLITIMTAGLVAAIWLVAEPLLSGLFSDAVSGVQGP